MNTHDFDHQMRLSADYVPQGFQLSPGIAISSAGSAARTVFEIQDAMRMGASGVTIWYYNYLLSYKDALADMKSEAFPEKAMPGYDDLIMDTDGHGMFKCSGVWTFQRSGYNGTYLSAPAIKGDTAEFSVRVLREGNYALYGYWSGNPRVNSSDATAQVSASALARSCTVNEEKNINSWMKLGNYHLNSGDTLTVKLFGTYGRQLVANAFRLRRESAVFDRLGGTR